MPIRSRYLLKPGGRFNILEAGGGGFGPPRWASGGMDTLPHNGAVITLLAVTGLTHR
jgi:hypothetical protein